MNTTLPTCPTCGATIPAGTPAGACPACVLELGLGEADPAPAAPGVTPTAAIPPRVRYFGDYELLGEIARGGMGVVYRARQVSLRRTVAIKMIAAGALASREAVVRFHTEAAAAARLDHPHIVPIHEIGEFEGRHYFSMKFVEGGSLADALRAGAYAPRAAATLVARVARAIHFAHQRGVLHRDLKPGNILLGTDGEPFVTDFGLALLVDHAGDLTRTQAVLGTPAYMSPEQALGAKREISTATDVYSLGAVLYEMLTGRPPFAAESPIELLRRLVDTEPTRPRSLQPLLDRDLEIVCLRCLEKSPSQRYPSALALSEDLERWLRHEPIAARPATPRERATKWLRRHPAVAGLGAALAATFLLGFGAVTWQWQQARRALERAEQAARAQQTAAAPVIPPSTVFTNDLAASRTLIAGSVQIGLGPDARGRLAAWDAVQGRRLPGFDDANGLVARASLSADGRRLVTVSVYTNIALEPVQRSGQTLAAIPCFQQPEVAEVRETATGRRLCRLDLPDTLAPTTVATLSPDGSRVLTGHQDGHAHLWNADTGEHLRSLPGHTSAIRWVGFSPDGRRLVTCGSGWRGTGLALLGVPEPILARVHDGTDGREICVLRNRRPAFLPFSGRVGQDEIVATFSPDGGRLAVRTRRTRNAGLWDAESGRFLAPVHHGDAEVLDLAFSPDGRWLATAGADHRVRVWDATTGALRWELTGHQRPLSFVRFSPDSRRLLSGAEDFDLRLWDVEAGVGVALLRGHTGRHLNAVFVSNGEVISTGDDGTLRRWTTATSEQLAPRLTGHRGGVSGLAFTPDSRQLLSTGADACARLWSVAEGRERRVYTGWPGLAPALHEQVLGTLHDAAIDPTGGWFVVNSDEWSARVHRWRVPFGTPRPLPYQPVRFWDLANGELKLALNVGPLGAEQIHLSPDGRRLAVLEGRIRRDAWLTSAGIRYRADFGPVTIGTPRRLTLYDTTNGSELGRTPEFPDLILNVSFTPDGRYLLVGHGQGVSVLDGTNAAPRTTFAAREDGEPGGAGGGFVGFRTGPLGHRLVAQPGNASLATYDTTTWRRLARVPDLGEWIADTWLVNEEREILTFTAAGSLIRHDATTGQVLGRVGGLKKQLRFYALSPDEQRLAVVQNERQVVVVDVRSGTPLATFDGHLVPVVALAFSPDGRWLASGDDEGVIRLWPLVTERKPAPAETAAPTPREG